VLAYDATIGASWTLAVRSRRRIEGTREIRRSGSRGPAVLEGVVSGRRQTGGITFLKALRELEPKAEPTRKAAAFSAAVLPLLGSNQDSLEERTPGADDLSGWCGIPQDDRSSVD
jgi:hypothetical protein